MKASELEMIVKNAGGGENALTYCHDLIEKIDRIESAGGFVELLKQLRSSNEPGDFRGRVLEINFADCFIKKEQFLTYGAKQGMAGDIDFSFKFGNHDVFVELKLLGQDQLTKHSEAKQMEQSGYYKTIVPDDLQDIVRIQRDIFKKSSTKKFDSSLKDGVINLVAIDITELQVGTIDLQDCLLAVCGNSQVEQQFQRPNIIGVFEQTQMARTTKQKNWVSDCHQRTDERIPHPRDYLHGVLFLFREPKETSALSFKLTGAVVWNSSLVDKTFAKSFSNSLCRIVPCAKVH